jgi:apolipoprotein N-acyltransferase
LGLPLALLSGALLALSFPRYGHPAVAFVALVPLVVALSGWQGRPGVYPGVPARRGFVLGLAAGIVHYLGTLYWTSTTVQTFGGLPLPVAVLAMFALVLYMAAYPALFGAATGYAVRRLGSRGLMMAPLAWVALEYLREFVLGGFPWIPLGSAIVDLLAVAQLASVTGVYGVSLLLATLAVIIALAITGRGRDRLVAAAAGVALLTGVSTWGALRVREGHLVRTGDPATISLIQANVLQEEKWDRSRSGEIVARYLAMSRQAAAEGADVIMWPESATPFYFDEDPVAAAVVRRMVSEIGRPLLFGTDEIERGLGGPDRYYNSAFMLDSGGATAAVYRKIKLVPFGEFVPLKSLLFFVGPLIDSVSDFSPGLTVTMLPMGEHMASTAVCYEVVYPKLAREAVLRGAELLTTITNDAWYGYSSAPYQHFEMARMRAIEQGRYLARAANTGISGIVDPYGRVTLKSAMFERQILHGRIRFLRERTVYARIGDVVPQAASVLAALVLALAVVRRPRGHQR